MKSMEASVLTDRPKPRLRGVVHLIASIAFVPAVVALILHARTGSGLTAFVFGGSLVAVLSVSAIYHTPRWPEPIRARLRLLDHSMIYVLIAGSYTPLCSPLGGSAATIMLPLVWVAALLGVVKSLLWIESPRWVTAGLYVMFGWAVIPYASDLYVVLGPTILTLIAIGGFLYTLGAVVYACKWPNPAPSTFGYHEIFHVLVVAASTCHYAAVWMTVS